MGQRVDTMTFSLDAELAVHFDQELSMLVPEWELKSFIININEMDIADQASPLEPIVRDRFIARAYENYLSVMLNEPLVIVMLIWALSDHYAWLSEFKSCSDNAPA